MLCTFIFSEPLPPWPLLFFRRFAWFYFSNPYIYTYNVCSVAQSCVKLCHPIDCSLPGSSVHGIFQVRILEWVAISLSSRSSWPRGWTHVSCISCIGRGLLYHCVTWQAHIHLLLSHVVLKIVITVQHFPFLFFIAFCPHFMATVSSQISCKLLRIFI